MSRFSLPHGYTRITPLEKPKLAPLLPVVDSMLQANQAAPVEQQHSAERIFARLRDEHGFAGGYTVVKDDVRVCWARGSETFVPLAHPPGQAQLDFGEAVATIGGMRQKNPRFLHGRAAVSRPLRKCASAGDDRCVPGRTRLGVRVLRWHA